MPAVNRAVEPKPEAVELAWLDMFGDRVRVEEPRALRLRADLGVARSVGSRALSSILFSVALRLACCSARRSASPGSRFQLDVPPSSPRGVRDAGLSGADVLARGVGMDAPAGRAARGVRFAASAKPNLRGAGPAVRT